MKALILAALAGVAVLAAEPARPVKLAKADADAVVKEILKDRTDTEAWLRGDITSLPGDHRSSGLRHQEVADRRTRRRQRPPDRRRRGDAASLAGDGRGRQVPRPGGRRRCAFRRRNRRQARGGRRSVKCASRPLSAASFAPAVSGDHRLRSEEPPLQGVQGTEVLPGRSGVSLRVAAHRRTRNRKRWSSFRRAATSATLRGSAGSTSWWARRRSGSRRSACSSRASARTTSACSSATRPAAKRATSSAATSTPRSSPNGNYLLDFNFAYNPACAFSDHYNCPIPPRTNVLAVAIRAGEMDSHYY